MSYPICKHDHSAHNFPCPSCEQDERISQLERELAAVTAERDVLKADLCTFAVDMEKQLSGLPAKVDALQNLLSVFEATALRVGLTKKFFEELKCVSIARAELARK